MNFEGSWRNAKGFAILCIVVSTISGTAGLVLFSPLLMVIGTVPVAYLYLIGRRLAVYIDEKKIRYRGWVKVCEAKWEDITSVMRTTDLPYPRNRYHGPLTYEVKTNAERFVVNLIYFPPEFSRLFIEAAKRRGLMRRAV